MFLFIAQISFFGNPTTQPHQSYYVACASYWMISFKFEDQKSTISSKSTHRRTILAAAQIMRWMYRLWFCPHSLFPNLIQGNTVDGRNPVSQLRVVVYPIIDRVLHIPAGCLGFLPSTVLIGLSQFLGIFSWLKQRSCKIIPATLWWLLSRICQPGMGWRRNSVHATCLTSHPKIHVHVSPKQGTMDFKRKWIIFQLPTIKLQGIWRFLRRVIIPKAPLCKTRSEQYLQLDVMCMQLYCSNKC